MIKSNELKNYDLMLVLLVPLVGQEGILRSGMSIPQRSQRSGFTVSWRGTGKGQYQWPQELEQFILQAKDMPTVRLQCIHTYEYFI